MEDGSAREPFIRYNIKANVPYVSLISKISYYTFFYHWDGISFVSYGKISQSQVQVALREADNEYVLPEVIVTVSAT